MNLIKQLAGQTIIYGFGHILSRVVYYFMITVLLSYLVGDETVQFSIIGYFYGFMTVLLILFSFRLDTALFRFGSKQENFLKTYQTCQTIIFISSVFIILIGLLFNKYIASLTPYADHPEYVTWFCLILAFDIYNLVPFAKLRLENRAKVFALCKVFNVVVSASLILFLIYLLPRIESMYALLKRDNVVDYVFFANIIASGLLTLLLIRITGLPQLKISTSLLKRMVFYAAPLVVLSLGNNFIQFFGVPLQEAFLGESSLENQSLAGIYENNRRIAMLFAMFTTAFNYAAEPFFFKNSDPTTRKLYYGKICKLFTLVGGVIILGMVFNLEAVKFLMGEPFREGLHVIAPLLIAYLLLGLYYNISIWYKLSDQTIYGAIIAIIGAAVFFILNCVLLKSYGYALTAYATIIAYSVMLVLAYIIGQRKFPIDYPIRNIVLNVLLIITVTYLSFKIDNYFDFWMAYTIKALVFVSYLIYVFQSERETWKMALVRKSS